MDIERTIEFLLNNQAKHDAALSSLVEIVGTLAQHMSQLDGAMASLAESMAILAKRSAGH